MAGKSKEIYAVIYSYNYNSTASNAFTVKFHFCSVTNLPAAAKNPEVNWKLFAAGFCRGPDIQIKTVFAYWNIRVY